MPDDMKPAGGTQADGTNQSGDASAPGAGAKPTVEDLLARLEATSKQLDEVKNESINRRKELQELKPLKPLFDGLRQALGVEGDPSAVEAKVREVTAQSQSKLRTILLRSEVTAAAVKAGLRDPADAARMLDLSDIQVDLDKETVDSKTLGERLTQLKTSKPYLFADAPASGTTPPKPAAGTQDPGAPPAGANGSIYEAWATASANGDRTAMADLMSKHGKEIGQHIDSLRNRRN